MLYIIVVMVIVMVTLICEVHSAIHVKVMNKLEVYNLSLSLSLSRVKMPAPPL